MFPQQDFQNRIQTLKAGMIQSLRGEIEPEIEKQVIENLSQIYMNVTERFAKTAQAGGTFTAQPGIDAHPAEQKTFYALQDLVERMELDFTGKFAQDVVHGLEKDVEIGKIKIAFLDGIRRHLNACQSPVLSTP